MSVDAFKMDVIEEPVANPHFAKTAMKSNSVHKHKKAHRHKSHALASKDEKAEMEAAMKAAANAEAEVAMK